MRYCSSMLCHITFFIRVIRARSMTVIFSNFRMADRTLTQNTHIHTRMYMLLLLHENSEFNARKNHQHRTAPTLTRPDSAKHCYTRSRIKCTMGTYTVLCINTNGAHIQTTVHGFFLCTFTHAHNTK